MDQHQRSVVVILSILAALFGLRIVGQLSQVLWTVPVVPAFSSWQSGALAYSTLLTLQIALLALMLISLFAVAQGKHFFRVGPVLSWLGTVYFVIMALRAIVGFFELSANPWFDQPLPTAFHFVIASFILTLGKHWTLASGGDAANRGCLARLSHYLAYPLTLLSALCLFNWLISDGINMAFAGYLVVALGATAIVSQELLVPYRNTWFPEARTVGWDLAYLATVQVLLPALMSFLVVGGVAYGVSWLATFDPVDFWPHHWPLALQVIMMMLAADFLRYWLHRAAHRVKWLWAMHAVHHSPKELYTLNVGRFHPGDKALQFLLDAMPFALMGVGSQVLATYFVFYALNGFFQHSNANVRLGFLNWIIAGPELHRWHHAKAYKLANCNFGNNLIIWDTLFGTRYLPPDEHVGTLGIGNSAYPDDLLGQTLAPFVSNPDADARQ